ncbi:hypothetical protein BS78_05G249400 [Paspalum vaginatum]|nr:hypothetical protein BS78_05G249400 [Paspalum vaginatum]
MKGPRYRPSVGRGVRRRKNIEHPVCALFIVFYLQPPASLSERGRGERRYECPWAPTIGIRAEARRRRARDGRRHVSPVMKKPQGRRPVGVRVRVALASASRGHGAARWHGDGEEEDGGDDPRRVSPRRKEIGARDDDGRRGSNGGEDGAPVTARRRRGRRSGAGDRDGERTEPRRVCKVIVEVRRAMGASVRAR